MAVYEALEFYQSADEEALWGNIAVELPDAESAGRGLMNAIRAAAASVALAQLSFDSSAAAEFMTEVMNGRERTASDTLEAWEQR